MRFVTVRHRSSGALAAYLELKLMNDPDDDSLVLYMCPSSRPLNVVTPSKWMLPFKTEDWVAC